MYGQLSNRESFREVVLATQALAGKAYQLGFGKYASKARCPMPTIKPGAMDNTHTRLKLRP